MLTIGTTSACAENTEPRVIMLHHLGNYLRVRGEYFHIITNDGADLELPPRARRIRAIKMYGTGKTGTTSACAENTAGDTSARSNSWNYLRVRGEYVLLSYPLRQRKELPPRARRIRSPWIRVSQLPGTTSACAENTGQVNKGAASVWNYLRVRGEYSSSPDSPSINAELPPRARRIQRPGAGKGIYLGTTSACAENTTGKRVVMLVTWNYLRVRGEYWRIISMMEVSMELPPRARRIP